jgi:cell division ATPase FtsA
MTVQTETTTRPLTTAVDKPNPISIRRAPTEMVVGIDVGTTKVCSIAGFRKNDGGFQILAHSAVPCNGLSKGNVSDIDSTSDAIRKSVQSLQEAIHFRRRDRV